MTISCDFVSRETIGRLHLFASLVEKWTPTINLVSRADRAQVWDRHIADSLQVYECIPRGYRSWVDLGSGGGFPGVVVAILALEDPALPEITLVESDARKAAFLRTALRETGAHGRVIKERAESIPPLQADVVSARALADLSALLDLAQPHLSSNAICVFPKGKAWRKELEDAKTKWIFQHRVVTSKLDPDAAILIIKDVTRA